MKGALVSGSQKHFSDKMRVYTIKKIKTGLPNKAYGKKAIARV
jgi:hypothetical protein